MKINMDGESRRQDILNKLEKSSEPLSGTRLAREEGVSRQVIVQDIALLRASNQDIISTTKGYLLHEEAKGNICQVYAVMHTNEQIEDELNTFVDLGGHVMNVIVEHEIYGDITVDLVINNRQDVRDFVEKVQSRKTVPLMGLTNGVHYHTVEATSQKTLDLIGNELKRKGYLIS